MDLWTEVLICINKGEIIDSVGKYCLTTGH